MLNISKKLKKLAIVILIGGKSSRFGDDKGLFKFHKKPLISYQLDKLKDISYNIFLISNSKEQVQKYVNEINFKVVTAIIIDDYNINTFRELYTPMIGIFSAFKELDKLGYDKSLVLSCDLPLIKLNVIDFLIEQSVGFDCCIPRWENGFVEPLLAIYPVRKGYAKAKENLRMKRYKLSNILNQDWKINFISIEFSIKLIDENLLSFININELSDLQKIEKYL